MLLMKVIDLFAGCGGLSIGFMQNGATIKSALEYDSSIARTYKSNHPDVDVVVDDIKNVDQSNLYKKDDATVIIGGPPCQGFSMAGARIRQGFIDDPRNYLFKHYFNIVKNVRPKAFLIENVKGLMTMQNGKVFKEILNIFSSHELLAGEPYKVYYKLVNTVDFGIPQKRERVIIMGTLDQSVNFEEAWENTVIEIRNEHPNYFDKVTVRDAIENLPVVTKDGIIQNPIPVTDYQKYVSSAKSTISNHSKTNHSLLAINRMKKVTGGENYKVLDEEIKSIHSGAYGRLEWDEPAPTITTRFDTPAGGRFIHPVYHRTLSPREAARIQSFPDDFIFHGNKTSICKQIGNAVPPKLSYFLAHLIKKIIT